MTFYAQQILEMRRELYGRENVTKRIVGARKFIDRHYSENIDLDRIAGKACFSKYHFIRLFRKHYGRTPYQYLAEVRVARAKQLIRSGSTVPGACFAVGYNSMTSFSKRFGQMTGSAPSRIGKIAILDRQGRPEGGRL